MQLVTLILRSLFRHGIAKEWLQRIENSEGGVEAFSKGYEYYGLHIRADKSVVAREWAPAAQQLYLTGDFNNWQWEATPFKKLPFGKWELILPPKKDGTCQIQHMSEVKVIVRAPNGQLVDRLSPWATYVVQPPKESGQGTNYKQYVWNPPKPYQARHKRPAAPKSLRIYEAHVGIATEEYKVGTYRNFADNILPRIARQGYNAIQGCADLYTLYVNRIIS